MKTTKYASMLKKLMLVFLLLVAATVSLPAHATDMITNYTINFSVASGSPAPISGSFNYDSTNPQFTDFFVNWNGSVYDLTASANSPSIAGTGCAGEASTPAYAFAIMSQSLTNCTYASIDSYFWQAYVYSPATPPDTFYFNYEGAGNSDLIYALGTQTNVNGPLAYGAWTITAPEPSTSYLFLTGLLGLMAMTWCRKRPA
jgi:hypothetical protein